MELGQEVIFSQVLFDYILKQPMTTPDHFLTIHSFNHSLIHSFNHSKFHCHLASNSLNASLYKSPTGISTLPICTALLLIESTLPTATTNER
ncbi:hypothetical protein CLV60_103125 [Dyadobacter jiangsuensis]|uniref:Uncharacterized protein n=1 Tax=Dyadobacter jiangsuensis TaxID=1591085 RepID=A0A2P8GBB1_9BACT|nr:hypothetical protein CLV60_103125 [Dyadobacter jiangsuensis]